MGASLAHRKRHILVPYDLTFCLYYYCQLYFAWLTHRTIWVTQFQFMKSNC